MQQLPNAVRRLRMNFVLSGTQIMDAAEDFRQAMVAGLNNEKSSLKMLRSYLPKPTGDEKGVYLAVDFGGTNVRVLKVELSGHGKCEILRQRSFPLVGKDYDYTSDQVDGKALFEFIAEQIKVMLPASSSYPLGFTFSYPSQQASINKAILINWTKEIKTAGIVGCDVVEIFGAALQCKNIECLPPRAVINDTVGTLLTSAYIDSDTSMGSICGTGHNTCYVESQEKYLSHGGKFNNCKPIGCGQEIINLEAGNFDRLPDTVYDHELDGDSDLPGHQRLEKMVSGQYIGEIMRLVVKDFVNNGLIFKDCRPEIFYTPYKIKAEDISVLIADESQGLEEVEAWLGSHCGVFDTLIEDRITMRTIASIIVTRSAQLIAATYYGILRHIDPQLKKNHTIAIDGSVYERVPGYAHKLKITLNNLLQDEASTVKIRLTKEGSGVGAAIAAALVQHQALPVYTK